MALERQREIERGFLQQLAFRARLIGGDRLELGAQCGVEDLHVLGVGGTGGGGERLTAGEQRDRGARQHEARATEKVAARQCQGGGLEERHRWLLTRVCEPSDGTPSS